MRVGNRDGDSFELFDQHGWYLEWGVPKSIAEIDPMDQFSVSKFDVSSMHSTLIGFSYEVQHFSHSVST